MLFALFRSLQRRMCDVKEEYGLILSRGVSVECKNSNVCCSA